MGVIGVPSMQRQAVGSAGSHFVIQENIDKVKSAGCLLWGHRGAVYAEAGCRPSSIQGMGSEPDLIISFMIS